MNDIDLEDFYTGELERMLQEALNPTVPVDVFYAVLDRVVASVSRQEAPAGPPGAPGTPPEPTAPNAYGQMNSLN
jgi:hypothetical protein